MTMVLVANYAIALFKLAGIAVVLTCISGEIQRDYTMIFRSMCAGAVMLAMCFAYILWNDVCLPLFQAACSSKAEEGVVVEDKANDTNSIPGSCGNDTITHAERVESSDASSIQGSPAADNTTKDEMVSDKGEEASQQKSQSSSPQQTTRIDNEESPMLSSRTDKDEKMPRQTVSASSPQAALPIMDGSNGERPPSALPMQQCGGLKKQPDGSGPLYNKKNSSSLAIENLNAENTQSPTNRKDQSGGNLSPSMSSFSIAHTYSPAAIQKNCARTGLGSHSFPKVVTVDASRTSVAASLSQLPSPSTLFECKDGKSINTDDSNKKPESLGKGSSAMIAERHVHSEEPNQAHYAVVGSSPYYDILPMQDKTVTDKDMPQQHKDKDPQQQQLASSFTHQESIGLSFGEDDDDSFDEDFKDDASQKPEVNDAETRKDQESSHQQHPHDTSPIQQNQETDHILAETMDSEEKKALRGSKRTQRVKEKVSEVDPYGEIWNDWIGQGPASFVTGVSMKELDSEDRRSPEDLIVYVCKCAICRAKHPKHAFTFSAKKSNTMVTKELFDSNGFVRPDIQYGHRLFTAEGPFHISTRWKFRRHLKFDAGLSYEDFQKDYSLFQTSRDPDAFRNWNRWASTSSRPSSANQPTNASGRNQHPRTGTTADTPTKRSHTPNRLQLPTFKRQERNAIDNHGLQKDECGTFEAVSDSPCSTREKHFSALLGSEVSSVIELPGYDDDDKDKHNVDSVVLSAPNDTGLLERKQSLKRTNMSRKNASKPPITKRRSVAMQVMRKKPPPLQHDVQQKEAKREGSTKQSATPRSTGRKRKYESSDSTCSPAPA